MPLVALNLRTVRRTFASDLAARRCSTSLWYSRHNEGRPMRRLLVIEDDVRIREELCVLLRRNGYEAAALDGTGDVAAAVLEAAPDLVLLDLGLPGVDGAFVCREIRRKSDVPVIVVTSRNTVTDELLTLNLGADDFVPKPYNEQVLLARIASVLKRSYGDGAVASELTHAGVSLNTDRCQASFGGKTTELTKNELRILALLMRSAGAVVSRRRLMEELWATDEFVDDNTLTVNVSHLRATLAEIGAGDYIKTKRGMGYMVE